METNRYSSYSGTNYDRWSYEQAAKGGTLNDTPINKLQHKFWVTKQKVSKKLGREEDEHIVASDSQLDAKLELFKSINVTTCRLQRLIERYQDRIYFLAGEENALGRFLKEEGKRDKTRAGKMMVAAGKTMSYTGQQRLAIRVPLVRLYQEVETFRQRAIEDMKMTVDHMEKVRTEYRGALLWMKNVSTELDPDTFRQLEKFRKVQIHVKESKARFDKLAVDCLQKIDLLAASRCNMFSHALIMYQNTLVTFWDKTSKTMNHVNNGFKGYQYYEFNYIKDLATPNKELIDKEEENEARKENKTGHGSMHNLLDLSQQEETKAESNTALQTSAGAAVPTLDEDDEVLLQIDSELEKESQSAAGTSITDINSIFAESRSKPGTEDEELLELGPPVTQECLDKLIDDGQTGTFTKEWEEYCAGARQTTEGFTDMLTCKQSTNFLPSQLFENASGVQQNDLLDLTAPSSSSLYTGSTILPNQTLPASGQWGQLDLTAVPPSRPAQRASRSREKDVVQWFSLFAELDPLANPDNLGTNSNKDCL